MHKIILCSAFGFLFVVANMHFHIDVVSQYLRGARPPGPATSKYYGMNAAYSLGQMIFAALAISIIRSDSDYLSRRGGQSFSIASVAAWLAFCFVFIEYTPPKINLAIVLALLIGAALVRPSSPRLSRMAGADKAATLTITAHQSSF